MSNTPFTSQHWSDSEGRPEGGSTFGPGFAISWQHGPLGRGDERVDPNGAFVETIIAAAKDRLEYYQNSPFVCEENAEAIHCLADALTVLNQRTARRERQGTEGTWQV